PQHFTLPTLSSAHVWLDPARSATAVLPAPRFTAGRSSPIPFAWSPRLLVSPRPSWPKLFFPQHFTLPSLSSAQVWPQPAATSSTRCSRLHADEQPSPLVVPPSSHSSTPV